MKFFVDMVPIFKSFSLVVFMKGKHENMAGNYKRHNNNQKGEKYENMST